MADVPIVTDPAPAPPADPVLAERIRRLEEQLAAREAVPPAEEELANRVLAILAEKAAQQRSLAGAAPPPVPGLITTALTAARMAQTVFPGVPPGVAPQPTEGGFRSWLLTQVVGEFRLMVKMYFDPRYRMSRVAQFGVPLIVGLFALSYFVFNYTCAIPVAAQIGERVVAFFLAVALYKVLAREAARYRQVLDYLDQYGYA